MIYVLILLRVFFKSYNFFPTFYYYYFYLWPVFSFVCVFDFYLWSILCRVVQKMAMVQKRKTFLGKLEEGLFCCMAFMSILVGDIVIFRILLLR